MKPVQPFLVILMILGMGFGCAQPDPRPPVSASPPDVPFAGPALPVAMAGEVARQNAESTRLVSEAVRNYLRDALEEALASRRVFSVVAAPPDAPVTASRARITASIISARRRVVTIQLGPFASRQTAFLDAKMEVRLQRPGQPDLVFSGHSSVQQTEDAVVVASKQFTDWVYDDSWASVACKKALQQACNGLAEQIETEQSAQPVR